MAITHIKTKHNQLYICNQQSQHRFYYNVTSSYNMSGHEETQLIIKSFVVYSVTGSLNSFNCVCVFASHYYVSRLCNISI